MPRPTIFLVLLTFAATCASSVPAQSQQPPAAQATEIVAQPQARQLPGSIHGTVMDGTGAVVVGARVTLARTGQSQVEEALSGEDGQFSFAGVVPGRFEITITAEGFATQAQSGILQSGEIYTTPPITLALASVGTEVEVKLSRVEVAAAEVKAEEKQRVLGVVPNFYITYSKDAVPLSAKQKMELAWRASIDPVNIVFTGAVAGGQQAQNAFAGYGQGAQGYAKRFGANYTDTLTSTFLGSAILPAVLRQDPRYFYKGTGSIRSRILYAIANSVMCKGDNQHWQPNYSAIGGGLASGAISNLYYPPQNRGEALVFENTLIGTGETAILNIFQEFFSRKLTPHIPNYQPSQPSPRATTNPRPNP